MRFREHRGGLAESMETMVVVDGKKGLVAHIQKLLKPYSVTVIDSDVAASLYGSSGDARIGWEKVYIVTVKGYGVIGFSDSAIEPEPEKASYRPDGAAKVRRPRRP
jgi:hypothetical protein